MSLVHCPDCGHEVSLNAAACPNCGTPLAAPATVVEKRVVTPPPVIRRRESLPPWAIVLFGILGLALILAIIFLFRNSNEDSNLNVAVNANRRGTAVEPHDTKTTTVPPTGSTTVTVPETATVPSTATTVPSTSVPVSAPPSTANPDKGTVVIKAQMAMPRGGSQPARGVKFYLLDKDVESILSEAHIEPVEGNTLSGSMGLAAVFPDRYGDFQRAAMRAIAGHIKYSGSTDSSGTANLAGIKPNEYYLFSIARSGKGFAFWNSPVSVIGGENVLDLSPQSITEVRDPNS